MRSLTVATALLGTAFASSPAANIGSRAAPPCAQVSSALKTSVDGSVDPELALACLKSVPVDTEGDEMQIYGLSTFVNFQSTLAYLKNPPAGYLYPAVDFESELNKIGSKVKSGKYSNEYDVQNDLSKLWTSAHDGHFNYNPDIVGVFTFIRDFPLWSVSKDGLSVPEVYAGTDLGVLAGTVSGAYKPSPVRKINGEDVETYINSVANSGNNQDPDANYNAVFPIVPLLAGSNGGNVLFVYSGQYTGAETVIQYQNGTTFKVKTIASTSKDFAGVRDGKSFFNKFCKGEPISSSSSAVPSATSAGAAKRSPHPQPVSGSAVPLSASSIPAAPLQSTQVSYSAVPSQTVVPASQFYPKPWVDSNDGSIACYYPSEQKDLAVLSVPSFDPENFIDFEDVTRECLATAKKLGKKKLMIDLRGNGGGNVLMAYDMFKQLFPSKQAWGTTNFRAWKLFNQIGSSITSYYKGTTPKNAGKADFNNGFSTPFNSAEELTASDGDFRKWDDFYGPVHVHGDTFTNLVRYNLSDPYQTSGEPISDYGGLKGIVPIQTFDASDIVLLQDGQCASTCAVFTEFMKTQAHVGQIVMGGRAQVGPMQGVGGVKGANEWTMDYLLDFATEAFSDAPKSEKSSLKKQWGAAIEGVDQALVRALPNPAEDGHWARVNIRNNIRKGDKTVTPLQFVYEAADCRLFYTAEQIFNQALVWKSAYNSYWGNGACVSGSENQISSKPGTEYILYKPNGKPAPTPTGANASSKTNAASNNLATGSLGGWLSLIAVMAAIF